jgi:hypothetical protein
MSIFMVSKLLFPNGVSCLRGRVVSLSLAGRVGKYSAVTALEKTNHATRPPRC